jgi:hypothetical protein
MDRAPTLFTAAALVALTITVAPPMAVALEGADKCEATQLKRTAKYAACLLKAEARAVTATEAPLRSAALAADTTKCDERLTKQMDKAEEAAGLGVCPNEGGTATVQLIASQFGTDMVLTIDGNAPPKLVPITIVTWETGAAVVQTSDTVAFPSAEQFDVDASEAVDLLEPGAELEYQWCCVKNSFPSAGDECDNTNFPFGGFCSDRSAFNAQLSFNTPSRQFQPGDYLFTVTVFNGIRESSVGPFTVSLE